MAAIHVRQWVTALLVGIAVVVPRAAFAADDASAWGEASDGVRCRVVAIDPGTGDEAPDLSRAVDSFASADDVTLGVELENVSDQPVTLLGVRYGSSFGPHSGKRHTAAMGPSLFVLEFTDKAGQPIARPVREFLDPAIHVDSTSIHELAPKASLIVALRPAQFQYNMEYRLAPGDYQVRVRYRGLEEKARRRLVEQDRPLPQLNAWSGDAASNVASFAVVGEAAGPVELNWGEAVDGLRAAVTFHGRDKSSASLDPSGVFWRNTPIDVTLHFENVSDRPITICSDSWRQGDEVVLRDAAGKTRDLGRGTWYSGWPVTVRWTLEPGEVADISAAGLAVVADKTDADKLKHPIGRVVVAAAGTYTVQYQCHLGSDGTMRDGKGRVLFPLEGDWQGMLVTGETPLLVR
jgi:hypothetical protein